MRIYISGPMTGRKFYNKAKFMRTENLLTRPGVEVVNPARGHFCGSWEQYLRKDIIKLCGCDRILMLKGWRASRGARLEHSIAKKIGMEVAYECA